MNSVSPALAGRSIMVVEDEYLIALNIEMALIDRGAHVIGPFSHVDAAIEALSDAPLPHAAVLDINVRERPVFPVAEILASLKIPFVFATGYDNWTIPPAFSHVRRFEKPTDPERLSSALEQLLLALDQSGVA